MGHAGELIGIEKTLKERNSKYGDFKEQARVSQNIKRAMRDSFKWSVSGSVKRDALEMIAVKISRILTGDCNDKDSWHDIVGYAKLVEKELERLY